MGYCGGKTPHPTYQSIGDHTEAISIDYDPQQLSYEDLLKRFWSSHPCQSPVYSLQYRHAIFTRNDAQNAAAEKSLSQQARSLGIEESAISTEIVSIDQFTLAERYHQNYRLAPHDPIRQFLEATYPGIKPFADSGVATRLNAFVGYPNLKAQALIRKELASYGLPKDLEDQIKDRLRDLEPGSGS